MLEADGWIMQPDRTMEHPDGRRALPVYEGQMANLWDHRARTFEGFSGQNKYGRKPHLPWVTEEQHADPIFEVEPRYWMLEKTVTDRLDETVGSDAILAFRDVGAVWTNRRSMKSCLFPRYPSTHTLPVFSVPLNLAAECLAVLNSLTFDFAARSHMPGGHLTNWMLTQCPAPSPGVVNGEAAEAARRLSVTSQSVATSYGMPITPWDDQQRSQDMATLDVHVAKAYGLTRDEYVVVLDHFQQLHRLETKELGEARTRRLCLEAWDRIEKEGT